MAPNESFDPRTWRKADRAPGEAAAKVREPARNEPTPPRQPKRWLGLALSAAILVGGAVAAYQTRSNGSADPVASATG